MWHNAYIVNSRYNEVALFEIIPSPNRSSFVLHVIVQTVVTPLSTKSDSKKDWYGGTWRPSCLLCHCCCPTSPRVFGIKRFSWFAQSRRRIDGAVNCEGHMPRQIQVLFCSEKEGDVKVALLVKVWHDKGVSDAGFLEPNGAPPKDNSGEGVYVPRGARLQSCILSSTVRTARVPKSFLRIKTQMLIVGNVCLNACFEDVR